MSEEKLLKRGDVKKAYWYSAFARGSGGFQYAQGGSLAATMGIILKRLYPKKEDFGKEIDRYYSYFNTNIMMNGLIIGLLIAMEEKRAKDKSSVSSDMIVSMKSGLMGPIAGVGDTLQQGIIRPILLSLGIALAGSLTNPSILGPIFYAVSFSIATVAISYFLFMKTYDMGSGIMDKIMSSNITQKVLQASNILGCMAVGALVSQYVGVTTSLAYISKDTKFVLQTELFDKLMPGFLPLCTVLILYFFFRKGASANKVTWITIALSIIFSLLGIIGAVPKIK